MRGEPGSIWAGKPVSSVLTVVMFLAFIGLALSFAGLLASYGGLSLFDDGFARKLSIGMFVVWLPTVIVAARTCRSVARNDMWKIMLSGCPPWMRGALWTACGFGMLNFVYSVTRGKDHSSFIQSAGGHLIIFYGIAFCVMYSALHAPQLLNARVCINGHLVSPGDAFCPKCGVSMDMVSRPV